MTEADGSTAGTAGQDINPPRADANVEPWQREFELADAVLTLLIAASRCGGRSDADRDAILQHVTVLVAARVAERVHRLRGKEAAAALRKALGRRGRP
jgi:hypothetical protein